MEKSNNKIFNKEQFNHEKYRIPFGNSVHASMTVEATLVLPLFLFAMCMILWLGILANTEDRVQWVLDRVANEASSECAYTDLSIFRSQLYYKTKIEGYLQDNDLSISLLNSKILEKNEEIDLIAEYSIDIPFRIFNLGKIYFYQRVHTRAFVGVEDRSKEDEKNKDISVYVTKTGRVYHKTKQCPYLKLTISQILFKDLALFRNESGGLYKPCERCIKNKALGQNSNIWITNFGDRYHNSKVCSGLKRDIEKIKLNDAGNRFPCSKCF